MEKSFAFVRFGSFSHANDKILQALRNEFPDYEPDVVDALDFKLIRWANLPRLLCEVGLQYGPRAVATRIRFRNHAIRTSYFFRRMSELMRRRMGTRKYAFTFQTQALFDASVPGVAHFLYTDHTHRENLRYPGFKPRDLFSGSWMELESSAYRSARLNFTMSTNIARSLVESYGCAPDKVQCVYAGSNADPHKDDEARSGGRGKHILFIGIDWERKGGPTLLAAFRELRRQHPEAQLTIAGCSPQVDEPGCRVVGRVPLGQVSRLYRSADVFCMPSRLEPFGIVYLEAFAHGLPVVATDIGAIPDFVIDGETGYLVPPDDAAQLADRLARLLDRPEMAAEFGRRGRELVRERYTWQSTGRRLAAHIRKAAQLPA